MMTLQSMTPLNQRSGSCGTRCPVIAGPTDLPRPHFPRSWNDIQDQGATQLANSLTAVSTLASLDLWSVAPPRGAVETTWILKARYTCLYRDAIGAFKEAIDCVVISPCRGSRRAHP